MLDLNALPPIPRSRFPGFVARELHFRCGCHYYEEPDRAELTIAAGSWVWTFCGDEHESWATIQTNEGDGYAFTGLELCANRRVRRAA